MSLSTPSLEKPISVKAASLSEILLLAEDKTNSRKIVQERSLCPLQKEMSVADTNLFSFLSFIHISH